MARDKKLLILPATNTANTTNITITTTTTTANQSIPVNLARLSAGNARIDGYCYSAGGMACSPRFNIVLSLLLLYYYHYYYYITITTTTTPRFPIADLFTDTLLRTSRHSGGPQPQTRSDLSILLVPGVPSSLYNPRFTFTRKAETGFIMGVVREFGRSFPLYLYITRLTTTPSAILTRRLDFYITRDPVGRNAK